MRPLLSLLLFLSPISFQGELSLKGGMEDDPYIRGEYIPELRIAKPFGQNILDGVFSVDAYGRLSVTESIEEEGKLKPYRLWVRYASPRLETRLGLQKINFGPAKILRTLQWFDTVDPQDPLKRTAGVYGGLVRYYFQNNTNVWVWGLYGNKALKGLEKLKTDPDTPEWGGRLQVPLYKGEVGMGVHRRAFQSDVPLIAGRETRYALDGIWDLGIGVWFESAVGEFVALDQKRWQKLLTVGADYTFSSGIHILGEHLIQSLGTQLTQWDDPIPISAVVLDYKWGIWDTFTLMGYCDWDQKKVYPYIGWQRTYNRWQFHLLAFSKPKGEKRGGSLIVTYTY